MAGRWWQCVGRSAKGGSVRWPPPDNGMGQSVEWAALAVKVQVLSAESGVLGSGNSKEEGKKVVGWLKEKEKRGRRDGSGCGL